MDKRTRRQKLAEMAEQVVASPHEAAAARRALEAMPAPQTLSRDQILGQPDSRAPARAMRVWNPSLRVVVVMDEDDLAFSAWGHDEDWDGVS